MWPCEHCSQKYYSLLPPSHTDTHTILLTVLTIPEWFSIQTSIQANKNMPPVGKRSPLPWGVHVSLSVGQTLTVFSAEASLQAFHPLLSPASHCSLSDALPESHCFLQPGVITSKFLLPYGFSGHHIYVSQFNILCHRQPLIHVLFCFV